MIYTPLLILAQAGSLASHQPNPFIQFFPLLILIGVITVILIFKAQRKKHLIQQIQHKRFQEQYYYLSAEQSVAGPATLEALSKRYPHGSTLICLPGTEQWTPLEQIIKKTKENITLTNPEPSDKRQLIGVLLCVFLGCYGFHAFYAGRKNQGLIMFALGLWLSIVLLAPSNIFGLTQNQAAVLFNLPACILLIIWLSDMISLLRGSYKDGEGRSINKW